MSIIYNDSDSMFKNLVLRIDEICNQNINLQHQFEANLQNNQDISAKQNELILQLKHNEVIQSALKEKIVKLDEIVEDLSLSHNLELKQNQQNLKNLNIQLTDLKDQNQCLETKINQIKEIFEKQISVMKQNEEKSNSQFSNYFEKIQEVNNLRLVEFQNFSNQNLKNQQQLAKQENLIKTQEERIQQLSNKIEKLETIFQQTNNIKSQENNKIEDKLFNLVQQLIPKQTNCETEIKKAQDIKRKTNINQKQQSQLVNYQTNTNKQTNQNSINEQKQVFADNIPSKKSIKNSNQVKSNNNKLMSKKNQSSSNVKAQPINQPKVEYERKTPPSSSEFANNNISFHKMVKLNNFNIIKTKKFGDCFYESLSFALFDGKKPQAEIRLELATYLDRNMEKYKSFIPIIDQKKLIESIKKNGEYAQYITLKIAADFYDTPILLYIKRFNEGIPQHVFTPQDRQEPQKEDLEKCIKLLFTGKWDAGHFDVVIMDQNANLSPKQQQKSLIITNQDEQLSLKSIQSYKSMDTQHILTKDNIVEAVLPQNNKIQYFCSCNSKKIFKNFNSLRSHFYQKHQGVSPKDSSHDMKEVEMDAVENGSNQSPTQALTS